MPRHLQVLFTDTLTMLLPSAAPENSTLDAASGGSWAREDTPAVGQVLMLRTEVGKEGRGGQVDHQAGEGFQRLAAGSGW